MSEVNFYLKKPDSAGRSLIYLQYKYKGRRLVFSFGETIEPGKWNNKKQRVKSNALTTADNRHILNELLDSLRDLTEETYNNLIKNGTPEPEMIKAQLSAFINRNKKDYSGDTVTLFGLIDRFIANEITNKGKSKAAATLANYTTAKAHLQAFEAKNKVKLDFDSITLDFYHKYVAFLKGKGLSQNTTGKQIRLIKVFMNEANDLGYTTNLSHKHKKFAAYSGDTDAVYLTENEIINLFQYDFNGHKKLEEVRDLFVFGCFVGLRYSDYSNVKPQNIVQIEGEYFIKLITQKTKDLVIIPCNPIVLEIFRKYADRPNKLPKAISAQKFNEYIKDALKEAKFTETGRLSTDPNLALYDCVSSHTARRSFATNYYLQGFPTIDLMKITGHRTEKAFLKYIRVTKQETAKRLSQHIKKNWQHMLLQVA